VGVDGAEFGQERLGKQKSKLGVGGAVLACDIGEGRQVSSLLLRIFKGDGGLAGDLPGSPPSPISRSTSQEIDMSVKLGTSSGSV